MGKAKHSGKLAARYAKALLRSLGSSALVVSGGLSPAQSIAAELKAFHGVVTGNADLSLVLLTPMFKRDDRKNALEGVAKAANVSEHAGKFLALLFERDRLDVLGEIAQAFSDLADRAAKIVPVDVTTARVVPADEVKSVEQSLGRSIQGTPRFSWSVDETLLGGMVISYEGRVLDGSLRGRLDRLERTLVEGDLIS